MAEMTSLNGYEVVDARARAQLEAGMAGSTVKINALTSDRIIIIGDSYTQSSYTVRGKAYICKLGLFSDYVFESIAVGGEIYYGNVSRIRTADSVYDVTYDMVKPKYAMLCCYTNDIKTLTSDQYANGLRQICAEVIGRGAEPIICTEYHAHTRVPQIVSVNAQVAREFGCQHWDIASICDLIKGSAYAPFWGGSHPGTRTNAMESDNYEKFLQGLERPTQSLKLFRLRSQHSSLPISSIIFRNNEERAEFFKEINPGNRYLRDATLVDNCSSASNYIEKSEYGKLINNSSISFPKVALCSVVIPGDFRSTTKLSLKPVSSDSGLSVYVKDIRVGNYTKPALYIRFDYANTTQTLPTVGDTYTCSDTTIGTSTVLTVVELRPGEGDGNAAGYILFSGVDHNTQITDEGTGTLTRVSGSGDATITYSYKSIGYRPEDIQDNRLGGWKQLTKGTDGSFALPSTDFMGCIQEDKVDFLLVGSGNSFSLTDIEANWTGFPNKAYHRQPVEFMPNLGRDSSELIDHPTFGTAGSTDSNWNITPTTATDSCYPVDCTSLVEVSSNVSISTTVSSSTLHLQEKYSSGVAILEVWARYFPPIYSDGTGNQITEDSYDYAKLKAEIGISGRGTSESITLSERVNTHWKIVQFPIYLTGGMMSGNLTITLYSDKTLQIARVSLKRIPT
jgi:hypothetical protein